MEWNKKAKERTKRGKNKTIKINQWYYINVNNGQSIPYLKLCFRLVITHPPRWITLLGRKVLSMFEQDSLEFGFAVHVQQLLPKVHVGKYGGKRATSFQCILRSFLHVKNDVDRKWETLIVN